MRHVFPILPFAMAAFLALPGRATAQSVAPGVDPAPDLAAAAARDYRAKARFPAWSRPLGPGAVDPVMDGRQPTRQSLPDASGGRLTVWASDMRYEAGGVAHLYAEISPAPAKDAEIPDAAPLRQGIGAQDWTVTATVTGRESGDLGKVTYRDDGRGPDERRGDGVYTASFALPDTAAPAVGRAENIAVMVTARAGEAEYKAVGGFLYSHPAARLTGAFDDAVVDGDLVIRAQAEVKAEGRFHLSGTLFSLRGEPVATAQTAVELTPGRQWIDLTFYGLALSERGVGGPYSLGSVTLTTTGALPNALGPVLESAHLTAPYFARDFHSREFARPDLVEAAERLERLSRERRERQ